MAQSMSALDLATGDRICQVMILDREELRHFADPQVSQLELIAYVSIGAGETHVTVLDTEGNEIRGWTAVIGWSILPRIALLSGCSLPLYGEAQISDALTGAVRVGDTVIDATEFVAESVVTLGRILSDILQRTIAGDPQIQSLVLAAPPWAHPCLRSAAPFYEGSLNVDIVELV